MSQTMEIDLTTYAPTIATAAAGVVTTMMAWRKGQSQAKGSELDNVDKAIKVWRELAEGLEGRLLDMSAQGEECERARKQLIDEFTRHKADNELQMKQLTDRQMRMAEAMQQMFKQQGVNAKINLDLL